MVKVSPSKLELACACPAAPSRNLAFPFVETEASKRGSHLHEVISLILQTKVEEREETFKDITSEMEDADREAIKICMEVADTLKPKGKRIVFIEEKMNLEFLQAKLKGTPDLAYYDMASKTICVVDWKFGKGQVPDPSDNKQLMAYSLALRNYLMDNGGYEVSQAYLVICQPCGTAQQSYRDAKFSAEVFSTWEKEIKDAIQAAQAKDAPAIPGNHCKRCFCEAGKAGACPEFKTYSDGRTNEKKDESTRQAAFAVSGLSPVVVESPSIQFPIVVISEEAIAKAEDFRTQAEGLVLDQVSANAMGLLLQDITKFEKQVETNREAIKKPVLELGRAIDEKAKQALLPLREAKAKAQTRLTEWKASEDRKAMAIQAEFERKKREAETLAREAELKRLQAEQALKNAKNEEDRKKALEAAEKAAREQAKAINESESVIAPIVQEPMKIAGVTMKKVPEFTILDITKVPAMFLEVKESLLKKAIEQKSVTEKDTWLEIKWVDKAQSAGGRR
ncbi:MAG: DUF2800 domain-containing protein [Patescibacteria group bacterium]|nr:DUF2800 domain-containing protein [Patescibacteria group bacterium]